MKERTRTQGTELVTLDRDHPGFRDPEYRARRNAIARAALEHRPGEPSPLIEYTEAEHGVWRTVWENLEPLHARYACAAFFEGKERLDLDHHSVPQLRDVNRALAGLTSFRLAPVAGLVSPGAFLRKLGEATFLATQYMRHPSAPLYTPEPDVVHELVGHAITLADPRMAGLNRLFGEVALELEDDALDPLIRVYWWTLEFGAARRGEALEVYGAGLLSSFGELGRFEASSELAPFDLDRMAATPFDPTNYQGTIFVAPSFDLMLERVSAWLEGKRRPGLVGDFHLGGTETRRTEN